MILLHLAFLHNKSLLHVTFLAYNYIRLLQLWLTAIVIGRWPTPNAITADWPEKAETKGQHMCAEKCIISPAAAKFWPLCVVYWPHTYQIDWGLYHHKRGIFEKAATFLWCWGKHHVYLERLNHITWWSSCTSRTDWCWCKQEKLHRVMIYCVETPNTKESWSYFSAE